MLSVRPMIVASLERENSVLRDTLSEWGETDWGGPPVVHTAGNAPGAGKHENVDNNYRSMLQRFLTDFDEDVLLSLEDDVHVNRHLRHNLENWDPIKYGFLLYGTLLNSSHDGRTGLPWYFGSPLAVRADRNYQMIDTCNTWGAQAILIRRTVIPLILERWHDRPGGGHPDVKIPWIVQGVSSVVYLHRPSLVEHRRTPSLVQTPPVLAADFDVNWRTPLGGDLV